MKLSELHKRIRRCKKCALGKKRKKAVPGEGPPRPKVMFVGEAPGRKEDLEGKPFVGRAGKLLDELLAVAGLKRKNVFITSVVKCRPPKNRKPKRAEREACNPYLIEQIKLIKPRIIVMLGNVALKTMLGKKVKSGIMKIHRKVIWHGDTIYFPTFHPAAGIRSTRTKKKLVEDFKRLKKLIKENR